MTVPISAEPDRPAAARTPPTLADSLGGPLGMAESSLPAVVFLVAWLLTDRDVTLAAKIAVGVTAVLALARLARRQSPRHALSGLVGVAISAFVAARTGRAENYFLPGLLTNAAYLAAILISIAARWPLIGVVAGLLDGSGSSWTRDPERRRLLTRITWMWAGLFALRLAVQLPLYFAHEVVALGVARTVMGVPLFAFVAWVTYRRARPGDQTLEPDGPDQSTAISPPSR